MPHIDIQLSGRPDEALAREAAARAAQITCRLLGKQPEVVSTAIRFVPAEQWFIDGRPLTEQGRSAFHLQISVTDETNTKAEKARYLEAIHAAFRALRPDLHEVSYVHVVDARATAYGYGGRTQEDRYQAGRTDRSQ